MYAPKDSQPLDCPDNYYELRSGSREIAFTHTVNTGAPKFYQYTYGKLVPEAGKTGSYLIKMNDECAGSWALEATGKRQAKYKILHTDYNTHSLVWDCYNTDTTPVRSVQFLKILTTTKDDCPASSPCGKQVELALSLFRLSAAHLRKNRFTSTRWDNDCAIILGGITAQRKKKSIDSRQVEDFCNAYLQNTTSRYRRGL